MSKKSTAFEDTSRAAYLLESIKGTPISIFFQDANHRVLWLENPQAPWWQNTFVGHSDASFLDPENVITFMNAKERAALNGETEIVKLTIMRFNSSDKSTYKTTIKPLWECDGSLAGYLCSLVDISEEVRTGQQLQVLLREVAHRSKNLLAMVLSIASQTARYSDEKKSFMRKFTGRIQSLAKSQDAITESDWRGATVFELIERQITSIVPMGSNQVIAKGEDFQLTPNGAMHVGLALHELCTNAISFGALSGQKGKIVVTARRLDDNSGVIEWQEETSKSVRPDQLHKFGRIALERIVPAAVNGEGQLKLGENTITYELAISPMEVVKGS